MTEGDDGNRGFEALYRGLYPLVVRTVYLVVLNPDVAQEICNEAFLRLWQHRSRLGEHANERAWLMRDLADRCRSEPPALVSKDRSSMRRPTLDVSALVRLQQR
jgi:DNA-directed RNA polymerase specialized sigma24 family protein